MFQLPKLTELSERMRQSFRANLKGTDAWVWPNNIYVSAKVMAAGIYENFGFQAYVAKRMFAHTAPDIESLLLHGEEFGIPRKPAAPAIGPVTFTVDAAFVVDTGAILERSDGVQYRVVVGGELETAGDLQLSVIATTDGLAGNAQAGTDLEIISGVTTAGTALVAVGPDNISLGAEVESEESYRQRILFRKRNPPHGGSAADYVMWAGQVAGVSFSDDRPNVFVERLWAGPGTVRVFPLMFDLYDTGVPQTVDVERVRDYLETVRPAGANLTVAAPTPKVVNVVIDDMEPDTVSVREAVKAELADAFRRLARVAGNDTYFGNMPYLAYPTSFSTSWVWQAVANATGETRHRISTPDEDVTLQAGEIPVLGTVTFT